MFVRFCKALKHSMQPACSAVSSTVLTKHTKLATSAVALEEAAAIALAEEAQRTGNDQLMVKLLQELLAQPTKSTQEWHVVALLSKSFRVLKDCNPALLLAAVCAVGTRR